MSNSLSSIFLRPGVMAFATVVMWSFSFPASKVAYEYFSAIDIVLLRHLFASLFFVIIFLTGKVVRLQRKDIIRIFIVSVIGITSYQLLFVIGISMITPAAAAMIISMTPLLAAFLMFVVLGTKLSIPQVIGTVIGFSGVALICLSKGTDGSLEGYALMILAAICMATYFILQKPLLEKYSSLDLVCYNTWIGTLSMLWGFPSLFDSLSASPSTESIISIAIMGVFSSGIGFILWFLAIARSNPAKVAGYMYMQPIIVGIMAWYWLAEIPSNQAILGGVIVLLSLVIANKNWKRKHND